MSTLSAVHVHPLLTPHLNHFHVVDAVRAMIHPARRPERTHYPSPLNFFLEDAAMAREMRHL
ncbi:hypothetical protein K3U94_05945 [Mycolicibacter heraklionensis]|uniref:Uncharacterized protein n=1 Tax=Mycolicibacter heraklionensis TaxID=512402 RepID=A0A9X7WJV0_9MYCO|nr:hypothetical protein [Mycolicibacter heraklionensis]QZA08814.1 hypothetical protein K3U94_05945 [Mycolicibacter heraklionensis]